MVEISSDVVEASNFFRPVNHEPLADPRATLIVNDGRNHLTLTSSKYDVIISEPSNPWNDINVGAAAGHPARRDNPGNANERSTR